MHRPLSCFSFLCIQSGLPRDYNQFFQIPLIFPAVQVLCQYLLMQRTVLAFLVTSSFRLNFTLTFEQNPRPSEKISGNEFPFQFFGVGYLSTLLQNTFISTLNKLIASIQSIPKRFCNHSMTNTFNFFSFPEKKIFLTILPKNSNLPPVIPLAIFLENIKVGQLILFQVSAFIIVKSEPVSN